MQNIVSEKEHIMKFKKDILQKIQEKHLYSSYNELHLIGVEENKALWRGYSFRRLSSDYYYTDLLGNLLFNGYCFDYATLFSDNKAIVRIIGKMFVLDIAQKELIEIPDTLNWKRLNGFRNGNLAVFDKNAKQWGSYYYDSVEKGFMLETPFIWDTLEFSRKPDKVYVGKSEVLRTGPYDAQTKWDERSFAVQIIALQLNKKNAHDLKNYEYLVNFYKTSIEQNVLRYIQEPYDGLEATYAKIIETPYNLSDYYFEEEYKTEFNTNQYGQLSDEGRLDEYQRILGKKF